MNRRPRLCLTIVMGTALAALAPTAFAQSGVDPGAAREALAAGRLPGRADDLRGAAATASARPFSATYLSTGEAARSLPSRDAAGVFAFVRDGFAFEPYRGHVRGARGALFSRSGNSLDLAMLSGALLEELGVDWRLARGELSDEQATELVRSAVPDATLGGEAADLVGVFATEQSSMRHRLARDHWWAEARVGSEWRALDPVFPGLALGETATSTAGTFAASELPSDMASSVTVNLMFRRTRRSSERALTFTAPMAELSYRNLVLRFEPTGARDLTPSLQALGETTSGTAFPRGDTESIWLEIEMSAGESTRRLRRDLRTTDDRVDPFADGLQVYSLVFLPGWVGPDYYTAVAGTVLQDAAAQARILADRVGNEGVGLDPVSRFSSPLSELLGHGVGLLALRAANLTDADTLALAADVGVRPYYAWPRVIIAGAGVAEEGLTVQLDMRSNVIEAIPYDGAPEPVAAAFQGLRGRRSSAIVARLVEGTTGLPSLSASQVLEAAWEAGRTFMSVSVAEARDLRRGELPDPVRERVESDLQSDGAAVLVPSAPLSHTSGPRVAWWLIHADTGNLVGVLDTGIRDAVASPRIAGPPEADQGQLVGIEQVFGFLDGVARDAAESAPAGAGAECRDACDLRRISERLCGEGRVADLDRCLGEPDGGDDPIGLGLGCAEIAESFRCGAVTAVAIAGDELTVSAQAGTAFWGPFSPMTGSPSSRACGCSR